MNTQPPASIDRLLQLLADQAISPLSAEESREAEELLRRYPHIEAEELELAAALLHASLVQPDPDSVPAGLVARIEQDAIYALNLPTPARPRRLLPMLALTGWLATAACLIVLISSRPESRNSGQDVSASVEQIRERLLADAQTIRYRGTQGARGGEVLWNRDRQEGVLELNGLKVNDPTRTRYQLWIVDATRPGSAPVDGGLFDVKSDGDRVAVQARLPVGDAVLFAVTEEVPEGVVVSRNEKLLVLAR